MGSSSSTAEREAVNVRRVVIASSDAGLRQRLKGSLSGMRWQVYEAVGGADAMAQLDDVRPEALVLDNWLPDLEVSGFVAQVLASFPGLELLQVDGSPIVGGVRSPRRHELLHALREGQETLGAGAVDFGEIVEYRKRPVEGLQLGASSSLDRLPGMVGQTPAMLELARMVRLVAPTSATVLIEGETGTGKELVAKAVHRLSLRQAKPFTVLNCAAIPEALLEAELFGHTRGAFTGAVQSRTGRIEAADGGTLFLDEIGEMPLALQAKMLRFLECGELQRVGDNEITRVDVRVVAATHQALERRATEGTFRLDLYHRLAVFPVEVPALRERIADLPRLAEFLLQEMAGNLPRKRISAAALERLERHDWPGNVRELIHVLKRGAILSGGSAEIDVDEIRIRMTRR